MQKGWTSLPQPANPRPHTEEIEEMKDPVILASVGSKDPEFDIKRVKNHATEKEGL